jgi:hypothetical protein
MGSDDEAQALFVVSAMIGTLLVSRVLTDPARSDALLATAREQLAACGPSAADAPPKRRRPARRATP